MVLLGLIVTDAKTDRREGWNSDVDVFENSKNLIELPLDIYVCSKKLFPVFLLLSVGGGVGDMRHTGKRKSLKFL